MLTQTHCRTGCPASSRIVEVGEPLRVQIEYAAHDLRTGHGAPWYAAAVAPPSDPTAAQ